jgi:hypothetical protein
MSQNVMLFTIHPVHGHEGESDNTPSDVDVTNGGAIPPLPHMPP